MNVTALARPTPGQVGPGAFYASQFWFLNGGGGYIGLQDLGAKGKIAIFSI